MTRLLSLGVMIRPMLALAATPAFAGEQPLAEYFRAETARLNSAPLRGIKTAEEWKKARPLLQKQMLEMLGLDPLPERSDLKVTITGTTERPDFLVDRLHFQSMPGLYVTANLYRPKKSNGPQPAILYVCGHSEVKKDGVIYGNKAHYQHHGAWFAANGYVCLTLDTLQLGEVPGQHHGTYRDGQWWWYSRGYTPAGVEAWNAVRAIDYLISRADVDPKRIGVTGRSGGGATSWWVGAIDDRVSAVCPVAGITDLQNHVVDGKSKTYPNGCVDGHCDCMFIVNTYRWDYDTVAALVAPKPLFLENTDSDSIFPEDGVRRVCKRLETVYGWYGASDKLRLLIGKGPHKDTEELRHAAFAFFEETLKGKKNAKIDEPDRAVPVEELRVLSPNLPNDQVNSSVDRTFVKVGFALPEIASNEALASQAERWRDSLTRKVFNGWPAERELDSAKLTMSEITRGAARMRVCSFDSQPGVPLTIWIFTPADGRKVERTQLIVEDQTAWDSEDDAFIKGFLDGSHDDARLRPQLERGTALAVFVPRGVGPTAWPQGKLDTQLRRRFELLGQTLDGMRVWDVRRAIAALRKIEDVREQPIGLIGRGQGAIWSLFAAAFEPKVETLKLIEPALDAPARPVFLNIERVLDFPQAAALVFPRPLTIVRSPSTSWKWTIGLGKTLTPETTWPEIQN